MSSLLAKGALGLRHFALVLLLQLPLVHDLVAPLEPLHLGQQRLQVGLVEVQTGLRLQLALSAQAVYSLLDFLAEILLHLPAFPLLFLHAQKCNDFLKYLPVLSPPIFHLLPSRRHPAIISLTNSLLQLHFPQLILQILNGKLLILDSNIQILVLLLERGIFDQGLAGRVTLG